MALLPIGPDGADDRHTILERVPTPLAPYVPFCAADHEGAGELGGVRSVSSRGSVCPGIGCACWRGCIVIVRERRQRPLS